jgi:broad specificity phosphatase PhoE
VGSLFLVRHSATGASAAGQSLGQGSDPPLSDAGVALADRLGAAIGAELSELPHDELRLVASSALRCRQTAAQIAAALERSDSAMEVEPGLLEIDYGGWEGLTPEECMLRDPALRAAWEEDPYLTRCPGGESGADVAARAFAVLTPIEEWLTGERARCAIAVAHNHVNRLRLCALMGWPMREYRRRVVQDPGGYSIVTFAGGMPILRRLNSAAGAALASGRPPGRKSRAPRATV